ncbi:hypothetical protein, partial [Bacillus subtilis]|uniref:hypothetical protein n=1 Tax=Bacillus subtilis TaxID=1423 RepID=UPI001BDB9685
VLWRCVEGFVVVNGFIMKMDLMEWGNEHVFKGVNGLGVGLNEEVGVIIVDGEGGERVGLTVEEGERCCMLSLKKFGGGLGGVC